MINIIYTICLFNILIIIFKLFEKYKVNNLQALTVNYITATIFSYIFLKKNPSIGYILASEWIYHAIIIGILFIVVFNFFAFGTQKVGISITTVANKMSLIIPVALALILYPQENEINNLIIIAFLLALSGIYLSVTKGTELNFKKKYLWLIILIFAGQGISDAIFNDFAQRFPNKANYLFFMTLFSFSSISGIIMLFIKSKNSLELKSLFWGLIFGIPNFFSLVFFLKALNDPQITSAIVFPLVSMGVIISSSITGMLLFKEKISINNWIGIILSTVSIYLFSI